MMRQLQRSIAKAEMRRQKVEHANRKMSKELEDGGRVWEAMLSASVSRNARHVVKKGLKGKPFKPFKPFKNRAAAQ